MKRNEWDDERHDERIPDKTIMTWTSQNSKRTPTGGQKPMEWVGWWTMQWTHFLVTTTWTSWNSKRTPTGGHKPPEQVGWQIMWQTWSRRDENPHKRAQTSGMSRTMNGFPNEMTTIQTSWNSKRTPIWEHEPHKPPLPAHPHPSVNFLLKLSYLGFFFTFSLIFISFVSLFLCHLTLITFCYNLNYIFAISGLKFRHQVQVWPLPEPKSRTPGSDSGSNRVQEVRKLDHGQSSLCCWWQTEVPQHHWEVEVEWSPQISQGLCHYHDLCGREMYYPQLEHIKAMLSRERRVTEGEGLGCSDPWNSTEQQGNYREARKCSKLCGNQSCPQKNWVLPTVRKLLLLGWKKDLKQKY